MESHVWTPSGTAYILIIYLADFLPNSWCEGEEKILQKDKRQQITKRKKSKPKQKHTQGRNSYDEKEIKIE